MKEKGRREIAGDLMGSHSSYLKERGWWLTLGGSGGGGEKPSDSEYVFSPIC